MFTQTLVRRAVRSPLAELLLGPHGPDRYTEIVDPMWTTETRATVVRIRHSTPRTVTLWLQPNRPVTWRAGQHLAVTVEVDGRRYTRCYSPANAEGSALIELTITRHDGGTVSGFLFRNGRPGLVVGLSGPAGDFVLPDRRPNRMLFIAGGSGITPVLAMRRTLQSDGFDGTTALLYYTRTPEDACYRDELVGLGIPVHHIHTRDIHTRDRVAGDLTGRFGERHLAAVMADPDAVFVCGPTALVDAVRRCRPDAVAETFAPPVFAVPETPGGGRIVFRDSGIGIEGDGRSLLEQAESAGLAPQSGCRMGICHTCTRRKLRGAVRNLTTSTVSTADDEDVQICVSVAVGDVDIAL